MDELKHVWGKIEEQQTPFVPPSTAEIMKNISAESAGLIGKLQRKVRQKLNYAIFFTIIFALVIPFSFPLAAQVMMSILFVAYLFGAIQLNEELKILQRGIDMTQSVLHGLEAYRDRIKRVIRREETIALTLYPVSSSGGLFLGMQLVDREAAIMTKSYQWIILILTVIISTLACHWLAKKMNEKAFGQYLRQLDNNIDEIRAS